MSRGARAGPLWTLTEPRPPSRLFPPGEMDPPAVEEGAQGGAGGRRSPGLQASLPPCLMGAEIKADAGLYTLQLTKAPIP